MNLSSWWLWFFHQANWKNMSPMGASPQVGVKIFETWEVKLTPRKFNIAPENWWLEDEFPFGMKIFLGAMWKKFRGVGSAVNPFMATSSFSVPGTFSCPDPCHPMECQPCCAISHSASQQNTSPTEAADVLTHWVTLNCRQVVNKTRPATASSGLISAGALVTTLASVTK